MVVGLGNPGNHYTGTRHNVGFMLVDRIAKEQGLRWARAKIWKAEITKGDGLVLVKPLTFMNDSGTAISRIAHHHRLQPHQILVVYDDVALPLGQIRLRAKGSAGGHNGIKDTIRALNTDSFPRVKIGISPGDLNPARLSDFVLGKFTKEERSELETVLPHVRNAVTHSLEHGFEAAMNQFNKKVPPTQQQDQ